MGKSSKYDSSSKKRKLDESSDEEDDTLQAVPQSSMKNVEVSKSFRCLKNLYSSFMLT